MKMLKHKGLMILILLLVITSVIVGYIYVNSARTVDITDTEAAAYKRYEAVSPDGIPVKDLILSQGEITGSKLIGTQENIFYSFDGTQLLLPLCRELREIVLMGEQMYISYIADDEREVILTYDNDGLREICVYDESDDSCTVIGREEQKKYLNFRYGKNFGIS